MREILIRCLKDLRDVYRHQQQQQQEGQKQKQVQPQQEEQEQEQEEISALKSSLVRAQKDFFFCMWRRMDQENVRSRCPPPLP